MLRGVLQILLSIVIPFISVMIEKAILYLDMTAGTAGPKQPCMDAVIILCCRKKEGRREPNYRQTALLLSRWLPIS